MANAARKISESHSAAPAPRRRWLARLTWFGLGAFILILIGFRLYLPVIVKDYVNRTLSRIPGYRAQIADVDIHLWRGAYSIQGLDVVNISGKVPVPFFSAPKVDLSVQWMELFHGALVGEAELQRPKLNFVSGPTAATSQTTVDGSWKDRVKELFPLRINRLEAKDGEVHYRDFYSDPKVDLRIDRIHLVALNLTNSRSISKTLAATIDVDGRPLETATLRAHADFDPYRDKPTFSFAGKLENADLTKFNDFLKAYGNFDVQKGTLGVYSELSAADGRFRGYVKPLIDDLEIFNLQDDKDSFLQKVWEGVVAATARVFRNHPENRFATKVSFRGTFDDPQYSMWSIVGQILKNTFVRAIPKGIEHSVGVEEGHGGPGRGAVTIVEDGEEKESTAGAAKKEKE